MADTGTDTSAELVHLEVDGAVATITLDSPHNRNALSRQLVSELFERLDVAEVGDLEAVPAGPFADLVEGQRVGRDDLVVDVPPVLKRRVAQRNVREHTVHTEISHASRGPRTGAGRQLGYRVR